MVGFSGKVGLLLLLTGMLFSQNPKKVNVAVIDLDSRGGLSPAEIGTLTDRLRSMLVRTNAFNVVDRGLMEDILQEQGFQMTGCTSTDCAVQAGKILGVEQMLSGTIGRIGSLYTVDVSLINVETSRIMKSLTRDYRGEVEGLIDIMKSLADELAGVTKAAPVKIGGGLDVTTNPAAASIYVDGVAKGQSPLKLDGLAPGEHVLKMEKNGYKTIEGKFTIETGKIKDYDVKLTPVYTLSIVSTPGQASVVINNKPVGVTPALYKAEPNSRLVIRVTKDGYEPFEKTLVLSGNDQVKAELESAGIAKGEKGGGSGKTWLWIGAGAVATGAAVFLLMPKNDSGDNATTSTSFPEPPGRPQ